MLRGPATVVSNAFERLGEYVAPWLWQPNLRESVSISSLVFLPSRFLTPSQDFWIFVNETVKPQNPCSDDCHIELAETIRQLQLVINGLRRHLKIPGHSAVKRFPPELLGEIFLHSVQPSNHDGTYCEQSSPAVIYALQSITQVCSSWRKAALGNPFLWTQVPIGNRQYTPVFLERSKALDVTLWGSVQIEEGLPLLAGHEEYLHRVRALSIMLPNCKPHTRLPSQPARKLQVLEIFSDGRHEFLQSVPPHWDTPVLKVLFLKSVIPSWDWVGTLLNLTSLTVDHNQVSSPSAVLQVRNALRTLQNLSSLHLQRVCHPDLGIESAADLLDELVTLPRLERLLLINSHWALNQYLVNMSLPNDVFLYLDISGAMFQRLQNLAARSPAASELLILYLRNLAATVAENYRARIINGSAQRGALRGLALHFRKDRVTLHATRGGEQMSNDPLLYGPSGGQQQTAIGGPSELTVTMKTVLPCNFLTFFNALVEQDLLLLSPVTLVVTGELTDSIVCEALLHCILRLPLTTIVFVSNVRLTWFTQQFALHDMTAGQGDPAGNGPLRLPLLTHLHICNFNFRMESEIISHLVAGVKWRQEQATSTHPSAIAIQIRDCEIEPEQVQALREAFVGNVEWDGKASLR